MLKPAWLIKLSHDANGLIVVNQGLIFNLDASLRLVSEWSFGEEGMLLELMFVL